MNILINKVHYPKLEKKNPLEKIDQRVVLVDSDARSMTARTC